MKIKFLLLFIYVLQIELLAQNNRNLPTINLNSIPTTAYETGKLSFKFLPQVNVKQISNHTISNNTFDIPQLDYILKLIETKSCASVFKNVLYNKEFENQHKKHQLDKWYTINFNPELSVIDVIKLLKNTNLFEVVEPVYKKELLRNSSALGANFSPNDIRFNQQWNFENTGQAGGTIGKDIKIKDAWDIETGKPNVIVALLDQGVQLNHPDLAQNIAIGKSYNFTNNSNTIIPGHHGTHTAGTIAAVNNNSIGISGIAGGNGNINSGIRLMSLQVYGNGISGGHAEAFVYAADNGASITSNSWAYVEPNVYELSIMDAIDYFIENGGGTALQGGLVVFAAGNTSRPARFFPSAYEKVICVAASNNRDEKADYSTFGSWVDITAPGGAFENAFGGVTRILSTSIDDEYRFEHGTSMACPHVAGVAALIASKLSGKASASDVREILLSTTDDIYTINPAFLGQLGSGRLNALKALQKAEQLLNNNLVAPVFNITATLDCSTINIGWSKNANNNNVIVLYNNNNSFPFLVNGINYNVGERINNATVLYKGNGNNFSLPNNKSLLHFFKVFSYNNNNEYSLGKTYSSFPTAFIDSSGSLKQNFDFPPFFPTQEWRTVDPDNDFSWMHSAADTNYTGFNDDYSICMYNYKDNAFEGRVDWLRSPTYVIKNADSISFSFYHAYKNRITGLATSDSLEVLVSNNCGLNWNTLFKKGGKQLATITNESDSFFRPFGQDKWQLNTFDLASYRNSSTLQFSFKAVNGKGNNLYIDNIKVDINYKNDISPISIEQPIAIACNNSIVPQVKIANKGTNAISTFTITALVDDANPVVTTFNGTLAKNGIAFMALKAINNLSVGLHVLKIITSLPNNQTDDFVSNDTLTTTFIIENPTAQFPLELNFEQNNIASNGWSISQQPIDSLTWTTTTQTASTGLRSAMMNNFFYNYNDNRKDDILSPIVELKNEIDSAFLIYSYAHATKQNPTANTAFDTLEISFTKDCGVTWQTLTKKWGNNLQTINQTAGLATYFKPSFLDWKRDSLNISGLFNTTDKVRFRFRNTQNFGNNLYLDDIKIYTKTLPQQLKKNGFVVYPNPAANYLFIDFLQLPTSLNGIRIINSVGKTVYTQAIKGTSINYKLPIAQLVAGFYTVQFIYNNNIHAQKFIKQ
jgi:subtilisin family serine protease